MNLPGPFWVSWRVGGRRRRSTIGDIVAAIVMGTVWLIVVLVWLNWQLLRGLAYVALKTYRLVDQRMRDDPPEAITAGEQPGTTVVVQLEIQQRDDARRDQP